MTDKDLTTLWTTISRKVLASILVDDGAVFVAHDILGNHSQWVAPAERPMYDAVLQCLAANTPPTTEAVALRVNGNTPAGYVQTVAAQFNDDDNHHLVYNTEQLRDLGVLMELKALGRELGKLNTLDDIRKTADKAAEQIGGILSGASTRDSSGPAVSELAWQMLQRPPNCIPTGLDWYDKITGGLWPGMNHWVAAPYKRGKTTVMRNCVLAALRFNNPVGVFCAEGNREGFVLDCQAMIATSLLLDAGWRSDKLRLSGFFVRMNYWQNGVMNKQELDALREAKEIWQMYPVHIWDSRDGIENLTTLRHLVKRGRVQHGITSYWADYAGLFGGGDTEYERARAVARTVQNVAQVENVAFCMLSQQNEEQIRHGKDSYSAGMKGGGDAPAAADFVLIPTRDGPTLEILLKFSRWTRMGMTGSHYIIPDSGLVADKWLRQ